MYLVKWCWFVWSLSPLSRRRLSFVGVLEERKVWSRDKMSGMREEGDE
jgi:hypothetical protein